MKTGINQSCIMQAQLESFVESCGLAQISEVELRVPKLHEAHYHLEADEIRRLLDTHNITVTAVNSLEDFCLVPDGNLPILRREVETLADYCRTCNCKLVVAPAARWFDPGADPEWITELSAKRLREVADLFGESEIEVGFEPIAYEAFTVRTLEHAVQIMQISGAQNVSLVADVYNLVRGSSTLNSVRDLGAMISMIHINDAPTLDLDSLDLVNDRVFPGDGVLRPEDWVRAAIEGGFSGYCSIEIFPEDVWRMPPLDAANLCAQKCRSFEIAMSGA